MATDVNGSAPAGPHLNMHERSGITRLVLTNKPGGEYLGMIELDIVDPSVLPVMLQAFGAYVQQRMNHIAVAPGSMLDKLAPKKS